MRSFDPALVPVPRARLSLRERELLNAATFLDLEIGCGVGLHPIQYAQANPDRVLVAIEHTREKFAKFAARLSRHAPLAHLFAVHANAISWVVHEARPLDRKFDRLFLMYPNPNPKRSDLHLRWHAMPFMQLLLDQLKSGAEITLCTNESFYEQEAQNYYLNSWGLRLRSREVRTIRTQPAFKPRSHFEKKYFLRGEPLYELRFEKP